MVSDYDVLVLQYLYYRAAALWDRHDDGLTTVEWIILIGIVAAMAATVGKIVSDKVKAKAEKIPGL